MSFEMRGCYDNVSGCPLGFWRTQAVWCVISFGEWHAVTLMSFCNNNKKKKKERRRKRKRSFSLSLLFLLFSFFFFFFLSFEMRGCYDNVIVCHL
jgi:hypothetical protein